MNTIKIVDYAPQYRDAFKTINQEWIEQYFKMEEADYKSLDFPEKNIINKGGHILMVLCGEVPVGTCALIKMDHPKYDYELAKMGVRPAFQGKGIGWQLGKAGIEKAQSLGANSIYLESNPSLTPAITLYRKLGFVEITINNDTPYERSNIQMEFIFK